MFSINYRVYLILFCLLVLAFFGFSFVVTSGHFLAIDREVEQTMQVSPRSLLFYGSRILADLYILLIPIIGSLFIFFILRKKVFEVIFLLSSFSGFLLVELILKPIFAISCPSSYIGQFYSLQEVFNLPFLHNYALKYPCYPSGHTTSYIVFFGYLGLLGFLYIKTKTLRWLLYLIVGSIIVLIGPSRVYLHVHWISDVIAGYLLGFALLSGIILLRYNHGKVIKPGK